MGAIFKVMFLGRKLTGIGNDSEIKFSFNQFILLF